eukprot:gnl/MRDRNA2_/MRDRNA2_175585_c0_seq1.p1 gnl/MRDRNA2_/MRDRNA2_175585_c0~~gnl/MRDRNA2_/MRDRNA2_175585_c0_seq1.p1  ORF type:complete len:156 (-),score=31.59 gnl/MRDRNA2_/MRDRNA2_175585_c0_seq1:92-559(-)
MKACCVIAIFAFFGRGANAGQPLQKLNDDTFEKLTQVSTGMTTGSWLVSFGAPANLQEALEEADEELRAAYIIPAHVEKHDSPKTWKRFKIVKEPTTLLFARGAMHHYTGNGQAKDLAKFAIKRPDLAPGSGEKIPPPPSMMEEIIDKVKETFGL